MSAPRSRRPPVAVLAAALTLGLVGAACRDDVGYGEATERAFLRACVQSGDAEERAVCECSYREIVRTIPFDRYRAIDRRVRDAPDELPEAIVDIVDACRAAADTDPGAG